MPSLTVIVAPDGPAGAVLEVLRDWSASGLLDEFVWVPAAAVVTGRPVPALSVVGGRLQPEQLQQLLASRGNQFDQLRVCVLVPMIKGAVTVSSEVEQTVAQVTAGQARRPLTRLRVLLAHPGSADSVVGAARMGWHNVLLAPEDAEGPGRGQLVIGPDDDLLDLARVATSALAGVVGLWRGTDGSVFDGMPLLPGENVRLARSFYRRLEADELERELRSRVASTATGLPRPTHNGLQAEYIEQVELATSTMAQQLWGKHPGVLRGPRRDALKQVETVRGFRQTLRLFFSFLGSALRNLPLAWYRNVVNKASSVAARAVHTAVYGSSPAAYRTVVNGRTDNGQPADWLALEAAAAQVAQALSVPGQAPVHESRRDLSALWRDFVAGGLTLADAGPRVEGMDHVVINTRRGVMRSPADIAPAADQDFRLPVGGVIGLAAPEPLAAADVLGAQDLAGRLRHAAADPNSALVAGRALDDLGAWREVHRHSYVVQVGGYLRDSLNAVYAEISAMLIRIKDAAGSDEDEHAVRAQQKRNGRLQKWLLIGLVVALVALGVLAGSRTITLLVLGILVVAVILAWILAALVAFYRGQQSLFAELDRRQQASSQSEIDAVNLREALRDQRRLTDAYHQYLAWSRVLGAVLQAPFGPLAPPVEVATGKVAGLPMAVRIGVAEVDDSVLANAAVLLRRDLLRFGWLRDPFESTLAGAASTLDAETAAHLTSPDLWFGQQAFDPDSALRRWSTTIARDGLGAGAGDRLWTSVLGQLADAHAGLVWRLLAKVRVVGPGHRIDVEEFMTGVDRTTPTAFPDHFDSTILTPQARTAGSAATVPGVATVESDGLSQLVVLTQISDGLPVYALALVPRTADIAGPETDIDASWATPAPEVGTGPAGAPRRGPDVTTSEPSMPDITF